MKNAEKNGKNDTFLDEYEINLKSDDVWEPAVKNATLPWTFERK